MRKLILASQSPGRKKVLEDAGMMFDIVPSSYEEDMTLQLPPAELAILLSQGKARDVAKRHPDAIVIAADTFGVYQNNFLGKPHTEERAREMLEMLRGDVHSMVTGFTIIDTRSGFEVSKSVESKIWFRHIPTDEIEEYIRTGEPLNKAGAYAIQGIGNKFVEKVEGSMTNIIGLPIEEVLVILENFKGKEI